MSEKRKYRSFTPEQKVEIMLAGLRGDRTVPDICREHEIAEALYYQAALATPRDKGQSADAAALKEARKLWVPITHPVC